MKIQRMLFIRTHRSLKDCLQCKAFSLVGFSGKSTLADYHKQKRKIMYLKKDLLEAVKLEVFCSLSKSIFNR